MQTRNGCLITVAAAVHAIAVEVAHFYKHRYYNILLAHRALASASRLRQARR